MELCEGALRGCEGIMEARNPPEATAVKKALRQGQHREGKAVRE